MIRLWQCCGTASFKSLPRIMQYFLHLYLAYFPKVGLCDLHPVCVSVYPTYHRLLNASTNLYETWYAYHGTCAHSVCLYVYPSYRCKATARLSIHSFGARQGIHATTEEFLDESFSMRSVSCQRRVCGSVCVSPYRCYVRTR
jgi:hypothetical protein